MALNTIAQSCTFKVDPLTPNDERVHLKEWRKLPGCESRRALGHWVYIGLIGPQEGRIKLPSAKSGGRRFTTLQAFAWWNQQLQA